MSFPVIVIGLWAVLSIYVTWKIGLRYNVPVLNQLTTRFGSLFLSAVPLVLRFNFEPFNTGSVALMAIANCALQFFIAQVIVMILNRRLKKIARANETQIESLRPYVDPLRSDQFEGVWRLSHSAEVYAELVLNDGQVDTRGAELWLAVFDPTQLEELKENHGLTLRIDHDGHFSEQCFGTPALNWFDQYGVQCIPIQPFSGRIVTAPFGNFIQSDTGSGPLSPTPEYEKCVLRFASGNTQISERVAVVNVELIRTISVVIDNKTLIRNIYVYEKH